MAILFRHRPEKLAVAEAGKEHRDEQKANVTKTPGESLKIKPALEQPDSYGRGESGKSDSSEAKHQPNITQIMKRIVSATVIQVISI